MLTRTRHLHARVFSTRRSLVHSRAGDRNDEAGAAAVAIVQSSGAGRRPTAINTDEG